MLWVIKIHIDDGDIISDHYGVDTSVEPYWNLDQIDPIFIHYKEVCTKYFLEAPPLESVLENGYFSCWDTPIGISVWDPDRVSFDQIRRSFSKWVGFADVLRTNWILDCFDKEIRNIKIRQVLS